jgi:phosphatidate phosphatase LPIN
LERHDLTKSKLEYTTQKLRQEEYAENQDKLYDEIKEKFNLRQMNENHQFCPISEDTSNEQEKTKDTACAVEEQEKNDIKDKNDDKSQIKDESKASQSKKKRRKKSMIKKKTQRKGSSSSSTGSLNSEANELEATENNNSCETLSNDLSPNTENDVTKELPRDEDPELATNFEKSDFSVKKDGHNIADIHFFSDGELEGCISSPQQSRPSSPVQSDTEFEVSQREKSENVMTSSASWKWGEPIVKTETTVDDKNALDSKQRNSMLSGMLNFMKQKRKSTQDGLYLSDLDKGKV